MARLKDGLFESALTGTDGFTSVSSATLDTASKIKGSNSARTQSATTANVTGSMTGLSATETWLSFYLRVEQRPTAGSPRLVTANNGSTQWNIVNSTAGALTQRNGST